MKQMGLGSLLYSEDYNGQLPGIHHNNSNPNFVWTDALSPYLAAIDLIRLCGADPRKKEKQDADGTSYIINDHLTTPLFNAFGEMYGWSNERAVFFSGVQYGRSPMIAVRAHPVKPRMVVYIKPKSVDQLAPKLADMERVVLVKTEFDEKTIIEKLRYLK